jgi:serine/threonine protein kinase
LRVFKYAAADITSGRREKALMNWKRTIAAVAEPHSDAPADASWVFIEGDEIVPGRHAVRLLGGGRRYEACLAWDDQLLALVVVKILRPDQVDDPAALAALAAEADMLERLRHPAIMRSFSALLEGARPHLVLEYLDGPHLSSLLRNYDVALDQTLSLGEQLCSAVHYMGSRHVVHLDIKPRNIIMAGPPRLIDFSVALQTDELAGVSSPVGTTTYMAPEQCDPARFHELGSASDVWGIGVTLYWALASESPFPEPALEEDAALELRYPQLVHEPAPLPADVPPALAELIGGMLAPNPAQRPTAGQVAAALEPLVFALPRPQLGRFRLSTKTKTRR